MILFTSVRKAERDLYTVVATETNMMMIIIVVNSN